MSLAIACWVRDTALETSQREIQYQKAFLNSMIRSDTRISTAIPGMRGYSRDYDIGNSSKTQKALEEHKEFLWVYKG
jgi:hypothetical protein